MAQDAYVNRQPDYVDLDLDFFCHPTTKDVTKKVGAEAIKRSVRNIVFTNFYEKPFQSQIGSDVRGILFEPITPLSQIYLKDAIELAITKFEPRVQLQSVSVTGDIDNNGFNVRIEYIILNRQLPVVTTMFLERIR